MALRTIDLIGVMASLFGLILINSLLMANAGFSLGQSVITLIICGILYAIVLAILMPKTNKEVKQVIKEVIKTVEKPVVKEVIKYVDKPVVKEVIKYVDKPIYKEVIKEKPIYIEKKVNVEVPRKKLNIPHYNYVGSTQTKRYHKHNCRLGKLIKKKFKVSSNSTTIYRKRRFKACKACMKRK